MDKNLLLPACGKFAMGLLLKNPAPLQKRLSTKEKEAEQREVIALSCLMFLAAFIVAGRNVRFIR